MQCFCQNHHLWIYGMPYPPLQYSTQHCFWSTNSLHSKWGVAKGHAHEMHWSYHMLHHHEGVGGTEGGVDFQRLCNSTRHPGCCVYCKLASNIWHSFFQSEDSLVQESRSTNRNGSAITSSYLTPKILLPFPATLGTVGLEDLVPKRIMLPLGDITMTYQTKPLEVKITIWLVWAPHVSVIQAEKGVTVQAGGINPDYQGRAVFRPHNGGKGKYVLNMEDL